eukprot:COSAG06_NODE_26848_length_606_cov_1.104536_1_plen_186_part_01
MPVFCRKHRIERAPWHTTSGSRARRRVNTLHGAQGRCLDRSVSVHPSTHGPRGRGSSSGSLTPSQRSAEGHTEAKAPCPAASACGRSRTVVDVRGERVDGEVVQRHCGDPIGIGRSVNGGVGARGAHGCVRGLVLRRCSARKRREELGGDGPRDLVVIAIEGEGNCKGVSQVFRAPRATQGSVRHA